MLICFKLECDRYFLTNNVVFFFLQVTDTNDNPPAFLESAYSFDIPENAVRGSRVGQVKAVDPDLGINAQLTYTVISDWANDVFSLNPQSGVFTLTARLDYEEVSRDVPPKHGWHSSVVHFHCQYRLHRDLHKNVTIRLCNRMTYKFMRK